MSPPVIIQNREEPKAGKWKGRLGLKNETQTVSKGNMAAQQSHIPNQANPCTFFCAVSVSTMTSSF